MVIGNEMKYAYSKGSMLPEEASLDSRPRFC
jgi:hypothetical protein